MNVALYLLLSGDALCIGLGMIALGASGSTRPKIGVPTGFAGVLIAIAAAVPLHPLLYCSLALVLVTWSACLRRPSLVRAASWVLLAAVAVVGLVAFLVQRPAKPIVTTGPLPVFVLGDSLSAGLGPTGEGTWPTLLAERSGRPVRSLARPGASIADGMLQADALPTTPCLVLIELGGNDLLSGATAETFATQLRQLLRRVVRNDRSIVMFELPLFPLQNHFGQVQREVSAEFGVTLIPRRVLAGAVTLPGHTTDGLHLSEAGHRWLAGKVAEWLDGA